MFVVDKEAKIRSLFVMPSAKTSGERDGALHKIACCRIFIQKGPQDWKWMGWFIKNLHNSEFAQGHCNCKIQPCSCICQI